MHVYRKTMFDKLTNSFPLEDAIFGVNRYIQKSTNYNIIMMTNTILLLRQHAISGTQSASIFLRSNYSLIVEVSIHTIGILLI